MDTTTVSPWLRPFPPKSCDIVVVGAGIIGVSTVHALAQLNPDKRVVLVDQHSLAWGASGRNAGFLIPGNHTDFATAVDTYGYETARTIWEFTMETIDRVRRLDRGRTAFRATGTLLAATDDEEAQRLERSAEYIDNLGTSCVYLDAERVNRRLGSSGFIAGLALTAGGTVNPARLVRTLLAGTGVQVFENWPVTDLKPTSSGGVQVIGPGGVLEADQAILCTNAFLPQLIADTSRAVQPVRAQMLATEPMGPFMEVPLYAERGNYYLRQRIDGRLMLGGARHLHEEEEVGYEDAVTSHLQSDLEDWLAMHFPGIGRPKVERRWSGTMGFSPDGLPVIGTLEGMPQVLFACGFTGHGMGYGLRFGLLLARVLLGMKDDTATLFSAERLVVN